MRPLYLTAVLLLATTFAALAQPGEYSLEVTSAGALVAPPFSSDTSNITYEAWIYPTREQTGFPLYIGNGENGYGVLIHDGAGGDVGHYGSIIMANVAFSATGNSARMPVNTWTHIAITAGPSGWKLYRNGMLVGRSSLGPLPPSDISYMGLLFDGRIDEVKFWSRERSAEEIRSTMSRRLSGSEPGLLAYYNMNLSGQGENIVVPNLATATGETYTAFTAGSDTSVWFTQGSPPMDGAMMPAVTFTQLPAHMKFLPRGEDDSAAVVISGSVDQPGYDSIIVEHYRQDILTSRMADALEYDGASASFEFSPSIPAELALHSFRVYTRRGDTMIYLAESADLVAGDVFLIAGQSNSHPTNASVVYQSPYLRSFGVQTANTNFAPYIPGDTLWGAANAHGFRETFAGPYLTGVWGLELQRLIMTHYNVPVCIINGGAGASTIEQNARDESDPDNLNTVYGRMLYRAEQSGLREHARAMFWHQGEANTIDGYANRFQDLYDDWQENYPGIEKVYVFQIRPGCGAGAHGELRELQRTLGDSLDEVRVMSTAGLPGHDGCHYNARGYDSMAAQIFRLVARDFYGSSDTVNITPPDVIHAVYTSEERDQIAVIFGGGNAGMHLIADTVIGGTKRGWGDAFLINDSTGRVSIGVIRGDTLLLTLNTPGSASTIAYLPPTATYTNSSTIYEGPWLVNSRGVGALSFYGIPVHAPGTITRVAAADEAAGISMDEISPNPVTATSQIRFSIERSAHVSLELFDARGAVSATLVDRQLPAGGHSVELDPARLGLAAGWYMVRLESEGSVVQRTVVVR